MKLFLGAVFVLLAQCVGADDNEGTFPATVSTCIANSAAHHARFQIDTARNESKKMRSIKNKSINIAVDVVSRHFLQPQSAFRLTAIQTPSPGQQCAQQQLQVRKGKCIIFSRSFFLRSEDMFI